ncbi:hypothetical protein C7S18_19710 [Ahniella affigens]|uniref:Uncharacterized protein n=1 Tax=Ahniella affigens TaxID=2021234 RepID=A0A2P1PWN4_9GAMM|nr:hypothetical protein [Ahniella affigens]AVP99253.1 hypothetical protein C7S18_19710 [Ahniella affigens]
MTIEAKGASSFGSAWPWIVGCLVLCIGAFFQAVTDMASGPAFVGAFMSGVSGTATVALIIALPFWFVTRKASAVQGVFIAVVLLIAFGQFAKFASWVVDVSASRRIAEIRADWIRAIHKEAKDESFRYSEWQQRTDRVNALVNAQRETSLTPQMEQLVRITKQHLVASTDDELRLVGAIVEFSRADPLNSVDIDQPGALNQRIARTQLLIDESRRYQRHLAGQIADIEQRLTASGMSTHARADFLQSSRDRSEPLLKQLDELCEARAQWGAEIIRYLTILKDQQGGWSIKDDGTFVFEDDSRVDEFNKVVRRINKGREIVSRLETAADAAIDPDQPSRKPKQPIPKQ